MKRLVTILTALALAAAGPLAAQIACGGGCSGSESAASCPGPKACTVNPSITSMSAIQSAVNTAPAGTVICVGPGTYTGSLSFSGKAVTVRAPSGAILTGPGPIVTFTAGDTSVLDGFTITGGISATGGGVLIVDASPTVQNCVIEGNTAAATSANPFPRGGGAYVGGSFAAPSILCTCFRNNSSGYAGGGLSTNYLAHPYLDSDTFAGNTAGFGAGYSAAFSGTANIENSEFLGNSASVDGGAIHVLTQFGHTFVRRTVFKDNVAAASGGGAWVPAGFATILNSVFDSNVAVNGGGAAVGDDGVLAVESSIFVGNHSRRPSSTLAGGAAPTTLVNNYNLFYKNYPVFPYPGFVSTVGNVGILTANPLFKAGTCYALGAGSPALGAGLPDLHFDNTYDSARNDMGVGGGPVVP